MMMEQRGSNKKETKGKKVCIILYTKLRCKQNNLENADQAQQSYGYYQDQSNSYSQPTNSLSQLVTWNINTLDNTV